MEHRHWTSSSFATVRPRRVASYTFGHFLYRWAILVISRALLVESSLLRCANSSMPTTPASCAACARRDTRDELAALERKRSTNSLRNLFSGEVRYSGATRLWYIVKTPPCDRRKHYTAGRPCRSPPYTEGKPFHQAQNLLACWASTPTHHHICKQLRMKVNIVLASSRLHRLGHAAFFFDVSPWSALQNLKFTTPHTQNSRTISLDMRRGHASLNPALAAQFNLGSTLSFRVLHLLLQLLALPDWVGAVIRAFVLRGGVHDVHSKLL